nr:hypothetical protein CFP56_24662 [Quercus suber]
MILPFLSVLQVGRTQVALCSQHGCCYTHDSLARHLAQPHKVGQQQRITILAELSAAGLAASREEVLQPSDGSSPFYGLPVLPGFRCRHPSCRYCTTNQENIKIHGRRVHGWSSGPRGRRKQQTLLQLASQPSSSDLLQSSHLLLGPSSQPSQSPQEQQALPAELYCAVSLQTLWAEKKHIRYFIVHEEPSNTPALRPDPGQQVWVDVKARYRLAQEQQQAKHQTVGSTDHVSELTPWLKDTGYHSHLEGLPLQDIPTSYQLPGERDEPELAAICASIQRLLKRGMAILRDERGKEERQLSRLDAKLLNTFRGAEMSQDPIKPLQNRQSQDRYISSWQKLVCYFYRVAYEDHFQATEKALFQATQEQQDAFGAAWTQAEQLLQLMQQQEQQLKQGASRTRHQHDSVQGDGVEIDGVESDSTESSHTHSSHAHCSGTSEEEFQASQQELDQPYSPGMLPSRPGIDINNYTSLLSQLIYDSQLIVLLHCLHLVDRGQAKGLTSCLTSIRDQWLLNDTPGPVAELSGTRLLGFKIGRATVNQAQVHWHADEQTIVYQDVQLHMSQLRALVAHELQAAQAILQQYLCFGMKHIPHFPLSQLVDNWDAAAPGQSFLTDTRNSSHLAEGQTWLIDQLQLQPDLLKLMGNLTKGSTASQTWQLNPMAVAAYQKAQQHFLEHLMVLLHVASGQPARRPEFLGLRWCNRQADKRNLFIHDGYLLFILNYHKSLNMTNSSRFPVRFILPEPFWTWLATETGQSQGVSEYLWHNGTAIWTEDKITQVMLAHSTQAIGVKLNIQAWRQSTLSGDTSRAWGGKHAEDMLHAGIYMEKQEGASITEDSERLCDAILQARYEILKEWRFQGDSFQNILEIVRYKNEPRAVRDVQPHVMPSLELLHAQCHAGLQHIAEGVDAHWTKCTFLCGPKSKPDVNHGLSRFVFTAQEREKLTSNNTCACQGMMFPFYLCEPKCFDKSIEKSELQALHSASVASNAVTELYKKFSAADELHRHILAFSMSHNQRVVKIFAHFALVAGREITFYRHRLFETDLVTEASSQTRPFHIALGIWEHFYPIHLRRIQEALARQPDRAMESFTAQLGLQDDLSSTVWTPSSSCESSENENNNLKAQLASLIQEQQIQNQES